MVSVPRSIKNSQPHEHNLQVQLSSAKDRIKTLEIENRALTQQLAWEDKLFANPNLSPSHKLALRATVTTVRKVHKADGLTKVYLPAIAEKIGLSAKTMGKALQFLADSGAIIREAETETDTYGQKITRVSIGFTAKLNTPERITPPIQRNHGGKRIKRCQDCGSDNLVEQTMIICADCGSSQSTITRLVNPEGKSDLADGKPNFPDGQDDLRQKDDTKSNMYTAHTHDDTHNHANDIHVDMHMPITQPADNLTPFIKPEKPMDKLSAGWEKPPTPPSQAYAATPTAIINLPMRQEQSPRIAPSREDAPQLERELHQAAMLLLDIAGTTKEHIVMNDNLRKDKKYLTVHRPLMVDDMYLHLTGKKTFGATLAHEDATTRALCFDTDDTPTSSVTWQQIQSAAPLLIAAGYKPLLEPSPAKRGGHLWIIFTKRVNARAAYHQVVTLMPELKDISEYWPSRGGQKVRLPAGRYVTPTFAAWTQLFDGNLRQLSATGQSAAAILLAHQTPSDLISPLAPIQEPDKAREQDTKRHGTAPGSQITTPDEKHRQKYGEHQMWVEWPDEQYLIDLFNSEHTIDELVTYERNGMINASTIGRPERTASVGVTKDGRHFTDFGAGARLPDGSQDGGDAFEFYCRSQQRSKAGVLKELGQQLNKEASTEILRAARAGELPPAWVMDIITDKGREVYSQNATRHGHNSLEERAQSKGGVGGFSLSESEQQSPVGQLVETKEQ